MNVSVVGVGNVRVRMAGRLMDVRMAVRTRRQYVVRVIVMAVIVAMRMLVLHLLMCMLVAVRLRQV